MTFIASVIAKNGVALVADSLATSQDQVLSYERFVQYLDEKSKTPDSTINSEDITKLFVQTPVFTSDYEEKIFKINNFIGITTAGSAYLNGCNIRYVIDKFKASVEDIDLCGVPFSDRLNQFASFLNGEIKEHIGKYSTVGYCMFIITHYDPSTHKTVIYKAIINPCGNEHLADNNYEYVTLQLQSAWAKVVCDGQNKLSHNILYGFGNAFFNNLPAIVGLITKHFNLPDGSVPADLADKMVADPECGEMFFSDIEIANLSELSIQQAVDLASLLMRLEVDFQKYTKTIPTVGGLIKLAVIDEKGFRYILGDEIEPPKHIHL